MTGPEFWLVFVFAWVAGWVSRSVIVNARRHTRPTARRPRLSVIDGHLAQGRRMTATDTEPVLAIKTWRSNAELIGDCARLGYLRADWRTLDPTYGHGTFWKLWRPDTLVAHDIDPRKSPTGESVDATRMPYDNGAFPSVVIDGPYKLNGTPDAEVDGRYGAHITATWQERMQLLATMLTEGARVLGDGFLLFKCQDQVCSGKVRWQTLAFAHHAQRLGLGLVDRLDFLSYRPQPLGTRQITARRNSSTMLVFKRGWRWT